MSTITSASLLGNKVTNYETQLSKANGKGGLKWANKTS